jgi:hypothetical protein
MAEDASSHGSEPESPRGGTTSGLPEPVSIDSGDDKKKKKRRGLWKGLGTIGDSPSKRKPKLLSHLEERSDSMLNLHLFLENRAANLALDVSCMRSPVSDVEGVSGSHLKKSSKVSLRQPLDRPVLTFWLPLGRLKVVI